MVALRNQSGKKGVFRIHWMDFRPGGKAMKKEELPTCSFVISAVVMIGAVAFSSRSAFADGKYFPEKAYKIAPAIPTQRAILVYKDGAEKLTIESALDGKGQEFGWIIPLPSKPTEFKEASPGLIKTLSWVVQPNIIHDLKKKMKYFWAIAVVVTLGCFIWTIGATTTLPERILLLAALIIVSIGLFVPHLGRVAFRTSVTDIPGIKVHDIVEIGSYELAVLEADNSEALNKWLGDNGFTGLTEDDRGIISDYIGDGWCFVAAKLRREEDGYSRPHPLSMSFATDTPVYPLRLTATTGSDVYLELFVIADRQAVCERLTLEISDTYSLRKRTIQRLFQRAPLPGFVGNTYRLEIGHPSAQEQIWDGCVLSKLCGTLKPKQMGEDIILQLQTSEPYQKRYYSHRGARDTALVFSLSLWCILLIALTVFFFGRAGRQARKAVFVKRVVAPALLFSLIIWTMIYAVLPKVNVKSVGGHWIYDYIKRRERAVEVLSVAEEHNHFTGMNKDEIAKLLDNHYASKDSTNAFTGEPIKHEDSPGNYTILEDERGVVWRTYSMEGYPDDSVLTSPIQD